jgi:hypothetical protein
LRAVILLCAALGAVLLIVSEFTSLFTITNSLTGATVKTVSTGSHDSYALIPIALVAAALALGGAARGSRVALVGLAGLGIVALLIALIGDLPDSQASGVIGNAATGYHPAGASPSTGLYLETLGAVLLIIAAGCGLLLGAGAGRPAEPRRRAGGGRGSTAPVGLAALLEEPGAPPGEPERRER